MADAYDYIDGTGVIIPDTADLLSDVQGEFKTAFGQNLIVTPDTPQGTLISAEVAARVSVVNNNAKLANQINPNEAGGIYLDAICALLGLERTPATRTTVPGVTVSGQAQTLIPKGSQARTTAGDIFRTTAAVTTGVGGTATVDFESVSTGPIPCGIGALNRVVDMVLGWETVNNTVAGTLGAAQQSDASLRALRQRTLALQGISISEAITSELYAIDTVKSLTYRENVLSTTQVIDTISLVAHSIFVCVDGGTDAEVAIALLSNKTVGGNWNGTTTVNTVDPSSGQTYAVKFSRPILVPIYAKVTIKRGLDLSDPLITVPQAILDYSNGLIPNDEGLTVGHDASPFEFAAAVNYYRPGMTVTKLELSTDNITFTALNVPVAINKKAFTQLAYIQVLVV